MQKYLIFLILAGVMTACTKEIDFDYHDIDAVVVIEGRVTNEGTDVFVSKSREMADSVRGACLTGATVSILTDGVNVPVAYDPQKRRYHSASSSISRASTTRAPPPCQPPPSSCRPSSSGSK